MSQEAREPTVVRMGLVFGVAITEEVCTALFSTQSVHTSLS